MVAMDSRSSRSAGVPYAKLIPMQPSPMADTSGPPVPSVRFCMGRPPERRGGCRERGTPSSISATGLVGNADGAALTRRGLGVLARQAIGIRAEDELAV